MNRNPSGSLVLSKALVGYLYYKTAEGLSDRSLESYERILKKWIQYCGDIEIESVTSNDITKFLNWLRSEYVPQRLNGDKRKLSPKTLRNIWIALSSFFAWASKEFGIANPVKEVPPPRFQRAPVDAFTQKELELMLKACIHSRKSDTTFRRKFVMKRPTANRDQAIILMLLDTGLRASELCALTIGDVDVKRGKVDIRHGVFPVKGKWTDGVKIEWRLFSQTGVRVTKENSWLKRKQVHNQQSERSADRHVRNTALKTRSE